MADSSAPGNVAVSKNCLEADTCRVTGSRSLRLSFNFLPIKTDLPLLRCELRGFPTQEAGEAKPEKATDNLSSNRVQSTQLKLVSPACLSVQLPIRLRWAPGVQGPVWLNTLQTNLMPPWDPACSSPSLEERRSSWMLNLLQRRTQNLIPGSTPRTLSLFPCFSIAQCCAGSFTHLHGSILHDAVRPPFDRRVCSGAALHT